MSLNRCWVKEQKIGTLGGQHGGSWEMHFWANGRVTTVVGTCCRGTATDAGDALFRRENKICSLVVISDGGRRSVFGDGEGWLVVCGGAAGDMKYK